MKKIYIVVSVSVLGCLAVSNGFAKGDASSSKLLSSCKSAIAEYCGEVKNKKDAKAIFDCLETHESSLKSEKEHNKCYLAHEAYEKAHDMNESGEGHHE